MFEENNKKNRNLLTPEAIKTGKLISNNVITNNLDVSNITGLPRLGINTPYVNNRYRLDVGGDINLTGIIYQNGIPYSGGGSTNYWSGINNNIYNINSGNVGIGNNNPLYKLDVNGTIHSNSNMFVDGSTNVGGNLSIMGNLGVGTDNPIYKLEVDGESRIRGTINVDALATLNSTSITNNAKIFGNFDLTGTSKLLGNVGIGADYNESYVLYVTGNSFMTGSLNINSGYLTASFPTYASNSIIPKSYVDDLFNSVVTGIYPKPPCKCVSTSNIAGTYNGTNIISDVSITTIDGYTVINGDRILLAGQTSDIQDGIYIYTSSTNTLTRSHDLPYGSNASGVSVFIQFGTINAKSTWLQTQKDAITGIDPLAFIFFNQIDFSLGSNLQFIGNILDVDPNLVITSLTLSGDETVNGNEVIEGTLIVNSDSTFNRNIIHDTNGSVNKIEQINITNNDNPNILKSTYMYGDLILKKPPGSDGGRMAFYDVTSSSSGLFSQIYQTENELTIIPYQASSYISFLTRSTDGGSNINSLIIKQSNGNPRVGINNSNPQYTLDVNGTLNVVGTTTISNTTSSSSTTTGAFVVSGGVGIGGSLNVASTTTLGNNLIFSSFSGSSSRQITFQANTDSAFLKFVSVNDSDSYFQIGTTDNANATDEPIYFTQNEWTTNTTYPRMKINKLGVYINPSGDSKFPTSVSASSYTFNVNGTGKFSSSVTATSFVQSSDYRIKDNIKELDPSFNVDKLKPVTYLNKLTGTQDIGLIAHEVQEIYPNLVNGEKDGKYNQSVNYIGLIGVLINEIQNLKKEVKELKDFKESCLNKL